MTDVSPFFADAVPPIPFTPLEQVVIDLASRERGRGLRPSSQVGLAFERLLRRLTGRHGIRPLADDRLEGLRTFINARHRCGPYRIHAAIERLRALGYTAAQERWLIGITPDCSGMPLLRPAG